MNVANKVLADLIASDDSFLGGNIPDDIPLHGNSDKKTYEMWENLNVPSMKFLKHRHLRI